MWEAFILLAFCMLVGLAALGIVAWLAVAGRLFSLDGLAFALITLTVGAFFGFNVFWSVRSGEARALLDALRKRRGKGQDTAGGAPPQGA